MTNEKQRRAFISYSRINKEFATKLVKGLRAGGYSVWFDLFDIPTGSRWDDEVEKALRECSIFMIILTPASIASENVKDEIGYAIDHGKRILPILLEECDVPLRVRRFQYVDFTTKSFEEGFESAKGLLGDLIEQASIPLPAKAPVVEVPEDQNVLVERLAKQQIENERLAKAKAELNATRKHETTDFSSEREKVLKASTLMAQGKELLQNGELSQAVQVFQQILTLMPNHEKTLTLLAEAEAGILQERESTDRKIKQESDRLAAQRAKEELAAKAKADTDRKAKVEADRLAAQKADAERKAKEKAKPVEAMPIEMGAESVLSAPTQKKPLSRGLVIGIIAVVVLAIAGIGFGVVSNRGIPATAAAPVVSQEKTVVGQWERRSADQIEYFNLQDDGSYTIEARNVSTNEVIASAGGTITYDKNSIYFVDMNNNKTTESYYLDNEGDLLVINNQVDQVWTRIK